MKQYKPALTHTKRRLKRGTQVSNIPLLRVPIISANHQVVARREEKRREEKRREEKRDAKICEDSCMREGRRVIESIREHNNYIKIRSLSVCCNTKVEGGERGERRSCCLRWCRNGSPALLPQF